MMTRFFSLMLMVCSITANAASKSDIDSAIRSGDYDSAYTLMWQYRDAIDPIRGKPAEYKTAEAYRDVIGYLELIDLFEETANKFEHEKHDSQFDFATQKLADINRTVLPNNYYVSADIVDIVDQRVKQASLRMEQLLSLHDRYQVERAEQEKLEAENLAAEKTAQEDRDRLAANKRERSWRQQQAEHDRESQRMQAAEDALKKECGPDYLMPRIGMTLARAQQCLPGLHLVGQVNRADGVVSQYRLGSWYVHAMQGKIVAWNRY